MCHTLFFFSSRRRHTRFKCDWSSDVCSSDLYYKMGNYLDRNKRAAEHVKRRVKYELYALLCNTIVSDSRYITTTFTVSRQRLFGLKKQMCTARTLSTDWVDIVHRGANVTRPWYISLRVILEHLILGHQGDFKLGHIIVVCTYVVDICTANLSKSKTSDVYTIVESLVDTLRHSACGVLRKNP